MDILLYSILGVMAIVIYVLGYFQGKIAMLNEKIRRDREFDKHLNEYLDKSDSIDERIAILTYVNDMYDNVLLKDK